MDKTPGMKTRDITATLEELRNGDESILREIYQDYRDEFVHWIGRELRLEVADAREVFQLSVVIFYDNVMTGRLTELSGSIKTYLFGIGKNKARDLKRKGQKVSLSMDAFLYDRPEEEVLAYKAEKEVLFNDVERALHQMSESCRKVLELFYYQRMSMDTICTKLAYNNAATAKNVKYKCLQRLKKMVSAVPG